LSIFDILSRNFGSLPDLRSQTRKLSNQKIRAQFLYVKVGFRTYRATQRKNIWYRSLMYISLVHQFLSYLTEGNY
jgi:hypothetical protein